MHCVECNLPFPVIPDFVPAVLSLLPDVYLLSESPLVCCCVLSHGVCVFSESMFSTLVSKLLPSIHVCFLLLQVTALKMPFEFVPASRVLHVGPHSATRTA